MTVSGVLLGGLALLLFLIFSAGLPLFTGAAGKRSADVSSKTERRPVPQRDWEGPLASPDWSRLDAFVGEEADVFAVETAAPESKSTAERIAFADRLGALAAAETGNGKAALRRRLLERAGELALQGEDPWKNLVLVALSFHRAGDQVAADEWFQRAIRRAVDPDEEKRTASALRDVVKGLLQAGRLDQARELANTIAQQSFRELALAEVATKLARRKQYMEARQLASTLGGAKARAIAFRGLADAQARYARVEDALATATLISRGKLRDDALLRVALARAALGDGGGAVTAMARMSSERARELAELRVAEY
ncbi:MAG: hypothetical protein HKO57_17135, partial [Akkermansiaceae bacterium]|nr:hypothetical protein [Akkermansiaceae bacterium]